jgi:hypothetical protein
MAWLSVGSNAMSDETTLNPNDILFSLATICDPMPAFDETSAPDGARWLHEDDWRQIEFVAVANREYIAQQLEALALFRQQHWRGSGWDAIYPRAEHPTPLTATGLYLDKDQGLTTAALTIGEPARSVRGGFALSDGSDWFILWAAHAGRPARPNGAVARAFCPVRGNGRDSLPIRTGGESDARRLVSGCGGGDDVAAVDPTLGGAH